jgi:hypothetical protein
MANAFDRYREALVIETLTVWPADLPGAPLGDSDRRRIEDRLQSDPAYATELEYVRLHAGFIRKITVTAADLEKIAVPP